MSLAKDTIETVRRLTALVIEETESLKARVAAADLRRIAEEKAQLADRMEQLCEAMKRAGRAALGAEPPELREALSAAMSDFNAALAANGTILVRRKSLSEDMIEAVLAEAKRQAGTQLAAYGRAAPRAERAAAIAYNANT